MGVGVEEGGEPFLFLVFFVGDFFEPRVAGSRCIPHCADAIRYSNFLQNRC